jgi:hypothetical protein
MLLKHRSEINKILDVLFPLAYACLMNKFFVRALFVASIAMTASLPISAVAATSFPSQSAPIRLNDVQIAEASDTFNNFNYLGLVTVSFTNTSSMPATEIVFALWDRHGVFLNNIKDVGNYAPGAAVRYGFANLETALHQQLDVEKVTFADGSIWTNSVPFNAVSRRQSR